MNTLYLQKNVSTPIRDVGANAVLLGHMICVCVCVCVFICFCMLIKYKFLIHFLLSCHVARVMC